MGKIIRLTEQEFKNIIENTILNEQNDKVKNFGKLLNKQDQTVAKNWVYEKDYKSKKHRYINDSIENLTGFFGISPRLNRSKLYTVIGNIFDKTMNDIHHDVHVYGMKTNFNQIETICKNIGTCDEDDENIVRDLLSGEFNEPEDID